MALIRKNVYVVAFFLALSAVVLIFLFHHNNRVVEIPSVGDFATEVQQMVERNGQELFVFPNPALDIPSNCVFVKVLNENTHEVVWYKEQPNTIIFIIPLKYTNKVGAL